MSIYIISDTHGKTNFIISELLEKLSQDDRIIFLGDVVEDAYLIESIINRKIDIVRGNNDYFSKEKDFLVLNYEDKRIFATHGHKYAVNYGTNKLVFEAKKQLCDIVLYGHTHVRDKHYEDGVLVINPGSLSYDRSSERKQSYAKLNIKDMKVEFIYED